MDKKAIPTIIRRVRYKLGLTQEQLVQKIGVSFSTVNEWENNKRKPSPLAMKQLEILIQELKIRNEK
jgi:putative transcriptional regulator